MHNCRYFYIFIINLVLCSPSLTEYVSQNICHKLRANCTCDVYWKFLEVNCEQNHTLTMLQQQDLKVACLHGDFDLQLYDAQLYEPLPQVMRVTIESCSRGKALHTSGLLRSLGIAAVQELSFVDRSIGFKIFEENVSVDHPAEALRIVLSKPTIRDEQLFGHYENITTLELTTPQLKVLPDDWFKNLKRLKNFTWRLGIPCVFEERAIAPLAQLQAFRLEFTDDGEVEIPYCRSLRSYLSGLRGLRQLQLINTFKCNSCVLPQLIAGLVELRTLQISRNPELVELPDQLLADQVNLVELDLSWNGLTELSADFFNSTVKLATMDLSHNRFVNIKYEWPSLGHLTALDITNNTALQYLQLTLNSSHLKLIKNYDIQLQKVETKYYTQAYICTNMSTCEFVRDINYKACPRQCHCHLERSTMDFIINCSSRGLELLPELPIPITGRPVLNIANNSLSALPNRTLYGYTQLTRITASGNRIAQLQAQHLPPNISYLDLAHNRLQNLNQQVMRLLQNQFDAISFMLAANPWQCDCDTLQLFHFLKAISPAIIDFAALRCAMHSDKPMAALEANDICPTYFVAILIASLITVMVSISMLAVLMVFYRQQIMLWLYERDLCLWYVAEADLDKDKTFDAFISYSIKDEAIIPELVRHLEHGPQPYKLCLHDRDWLAGDVIPERIARTVADSRRVLIVLSPNFLNSVWGRMEFRLAYQACMEDKCKRLIIILYQDVQNFDKIDNELKAYLKLNTYLRWDDENFWRKLRYAMPHSKDRSRRLRGVKRREPNDEIELAYRFK